MYTFDSQIKRIKVCDNEFTQEQIKNEPMLFSCDSQHSRLLGGPLTNHFLDALWNSNRVPTKYWKNLIVDSRVHMLMPMWFPAISGFHHDDIPRTREDKQPNYDNPSYHAQHCMMILGGGSSTRFALGKADFPEVPIGQKCYKVWHPIVNEKIKNGELTELNCPFGELVFFDAHSWHEATPAYENAWRFFIRASWHTERKPTNELRRQVQVYLPSVEEGW